MSDGEEPNKPDTPESGGESGPVENVAPAEAKEQEEEVVAAPRKRGRPRTRPESDPNKPKRPRGRPKGSYKLKKPRGRPKGSTNSPGKPKGPRKPVKAESAPGEKRGRGRPKGSTNKGLKKELPPPVMEMSGRVSSTLGGYVENVAPAEVKEEEEVVAAPRKRGPPRTRPAPDPNKPKRPRGRPKGSYKVTRIPDTRPKKPRGRPKGSTNSPGKPKGPCKPVKESTPGEKRGRGRPKGCTNKGLKRELPPPVMEMSGRVSSTLGGYVENVAPAEVEEEEEVVTAPRKRGRPRTRPEPNPNKVMRIFDTQLKKPRGRPKGSTNSPGEPIEPHKPMKESCTPGEKRRRGRPIGSTSKGLKEEQPPPLMEMSGRVSSTLGGYVENVAPAEVEEEEEVVTAPCKRGRPRTRPEPDPNKVMRILDTRLRKPRGRPKGSTNSPGEPIGPHKPVKESCTPGEKRRRGRPIGSTSKGLKEEHPPPVVEMSGWVSSTLGGYVENVAPAEVKEQVFH